MDAYLYVSVLQLLKGSPKPSHFSMAAVTLVAYPSNATSNEPVVRPLGTYFPHGSAEGGGVRADVATNVGP